MIPVSITTHYMMLDSYWSLAHKVRRVTPVRLLILAPITAIVLFLLMAMGASLGFNQVRIDSVAQVTNPIYAQRLDSWFRLMDGFVVVATMMPASWAALRLWCGLAMNAMVSQVGCWRWGHMARGFAIGMIVAVAMSILNVLIDGGQMELMWRGFTDHWFLLLMPTLLLVAGQATGEEFFFRAFLPMAVTRLIPVPIVVAIITAFGFTALHWNNSDFSAGPFVLFNISMIMSSLFWCWITLHTRGIEVASGLHTANNIAILLLFESAGDRMLGLSVVQLPPINDAAGALWYMYIWVPVQYGAATAATIWLLLSPRSILRLVDATQAPLDTGRTPHLLARTTQP